MGGERHHTSPTPATNALSIFYLINENQPGSCLGRMFDVNPKESAEGQATCPVTNRTDENPTAVTKLSF